MQLLKGKVLISYDNAFAVVHPAYNAYYYPLSMSFLMALTLLLQKRQQNGEPAYMIDPAILRPSWGRTALHAHSPQLA